MNKIIEHLYKKTFNSIYGEWAIRNKVISKIGRRVHRHFKPEYVMMYGNKIFLDPQDFFLLSVRPYPIHQIITKVIKQGDVVIDVGASIGVLTLYFAKIVGKEGKVYAFEPNPENFSLLKKNIETNNYDNVVYEQKAVTNKSGKVNFNISNSLTAGRITKDTENKSIKIESISLDDYFQNNLTKIDFIKIDTEGYDWAVIEGAANLIQMNKNLRIMTEYHTRLINESGMNPLKFLQMIQSLGFKIYDMGGLFDKFERLDVTKILEFSQIPNSTNLFCER